MHLRPYQVNAVAELRDTLTQYDSAVFVLPTGGGKTVIAGEIAKKLSAVKKRTLFLVHRRELVRQALNTLQSFCPGVQIGVEAAGWPPTPWAPLQIGMVSSMVRRSRDIAPDFIIIDEAHHARAETWTKVLNRWPDAKRLGLTATPQRLDGKGLYEHFDALVLGPTIRQLVDECALAPTKVLGLPPLFDLQQVRKQKFGDYKIGDIEQQVDDKVMAAAVNSYLKYASGMRTIFFASSINHSKKTVAEFCNRGVRAEHVDANDSAAHRDGVMTAFKNGDIQVISNCDLISEGFDAPGCDCVMLGRPTQSITKYLQQCGRAMRPRQDKEALILDLVGNYQHHGLPTEDRQWSLHDMEINERPFIYVCESCRFIFEPRATKPPLTACPMCGTDINYEETSNRLNGGRESGREEHDIPLIEVDGKAPKRKGAKLSRGELMRRVHAIIANAKKAGHSPRKQIHEFAKENGYKPGWAETMIRILGHG